MEAIPKTVLSLDVGDRRVGVAIANTISRLPRGLETIDRTQTDVMTRIIQRGSLV